NLSGRLRLGGYELFFVGNHLDGSRCIELDAARLTDDALRFKDWEQQLRLSSLAVEGAVSLDGQADAARLLFAQGDAKAAGLGFKRVLLDRVSGNAFDDEPLGHGEYEFEDACTFDGVVQGGR